MADATRMAAEIFLRDGAAVVDGEEEIRDWVVGLGLDARVRRLPPVRGPETLTWIVLLALPVSALLRALGTKAGEDVWAGLKKALAALQKRSDEPRPVVLQDAASGLQIILEPDLPGKAFDQLMTLDLSRFRHGPLHYDRAGKRWRSELDEAEG